MAAPSQWPVLQSHFTLHERTRRALRTLVQPRSKNRTLSSAICFSRPREGLRQAQSVNQPQGIEQRFLEISSGDHTFLERIIIACDRGVYDLYRFYRAPARRIALRLLCQSSLPAIPNILNFLQMQSANYKGITNRTKIEQPQLLPTWQSSCF
jgi:hypothetical protein